MSLSAAGRNVSRVAVIDDDEVKRSALSETISDIERGLTPVPVDGPQLDLQSTIVAVMGLSQAVVSDHYLTQQNYALFTGANFISEAYKKSFPGVLCTGWAEADLDHIRPLRQWIPVVINEPEPDTILNGLRFCIEELGGKYASSRKPWRALIRVLDDRDAFLYVVIPGWSQEVIKIAKSALPEALLRTIAAGQDRLHAWVNKGAESARDLYFDWTVEPPP